MTAGALPAGRRARGYRGARRQQATSARAGLIGRIIACTACCLLTIIAVKENYALRGFEAALASHVIAWVTSRPAGPMTGTPAFWFTIGPGREMALEISQACTVVLMTTPFLVATALMVWRKSSALRPVLACAVAMLMLLVVNQLRILTIIMFVRHMGYGGGFYWGHTLVGSMITIVGGSLTLIVYVLIAVRRGTPGRGRRSAH